MKSIKTILSSAAVAVTLIATSSCNVLDLGPIDYYGSGNFWTTEAQFDGYVYTLNYYLRNNCFNHAIMFGELRGGLYKGGGGSADGSTRLNGDVIGQNFDEEHTGVSSFANYYGGITQTNLFIKQLENTEILPEAKKNNYLGIAYGIRAFLYFDLYRVYGAVPLRLDTAVIDGELDPVKLYMARHSPAEVMAQIKKDLDASLTHFGDDKSWDKFNHGNKITWSKAATEYLAGEVYLWNAKVSVKDVNGTHAAEPGDITAAKRYFESVASNYGLSLLSSYADVFSSSNKANSEIIFAIRFKEDEAGTNIGNNYTHMTDGRGVLMNQVNADGSEFGDPMNLKGSGGQWYEYKDEVYQSYDAEDGRRDATFIPCYSKPEFDKGNVVMLTTVVKKNIGHTNTAGVHIWDADQIYYRLSGALLALAEIANYEGNNAKVEEYMNQVRERAYGANWADEFKYVAGSFEQNELAILAEKDKEFVQEGQRWWDLRRMTTVKGGSETDHLVFSDKTPISGAVLTAAQSYKVLWPLDKGILNNDAELKQTVGYETKAK